MAATCAVLLLAPSCGDSGETAATDLEPSSATSAPVVQTDAAGRSALAEAAALAEDVGSAALLGTDDGNVFFDWGATEAKLPIHSIRKPLLGAVFGIHVAAGEIDLEATLEDLNIDDTPHALTAEEKQATVRDLLMSRSGV